MGPEVVDLRQFNASDFTELLEAESEAWRTNLRWDYTASAHLIATCLNERRLTGYALVEGARIRGYSFFLNENEKGLIGDLFVEPGVEAPGYALLLLEHVLDTLMAMPGIRRVEAQLPHFSAAELSSAFAPRHFATYLREFMALPLARGPAPQPTPAADGLTKEFVIQPWERSYDRSAAQLLYHTYRHHVDAVINDQYASATGTARLIENIVHLRGCGEYLAPVSSVAIHRATGKLAGVLALTAVRPATAHIPQVAVAGEFQGAGLGSFLLQSAFEKLRRQGFEEVSLTVTAMNPGAVRLYERLGFKTFYTFGAFVWAK